MEVTEATTGYRARPPSAPCVLLVDDNPDIRLVCATVLRLDGYDVVEATNGHEALTLALAEPPDLVVLDVSMPVLDGFGLAEALRAETRTSQVPLVFLTGEEDPGTEEKAYAAGAAGFFTKPFDPGVVSTFVRRVLDQVAPAQRPTASAG